MKYDDCVTLKAIVVVDWISLQYVFHSPVISLSSQTHYMYAIYYISYNESMPYF